MVPAHPATPAYRLYGDLRSGSAIVELALAELDLPVDLIDVPLDSSAQQGRDYALINPQKKLPCLVTPDGEVLTESAAILLTLDERFPSGGLLPSDSAGRARLRRWLMFMAAELYPVIEIIDYPERFQPEGAATGNARRERLRDHARAIWNRRLLLVEAEIDGEPWFLRSGFSALDVYVAVISRWAQNERWCRNNVPRIERIVAAIADRRRLDTVWERHFNEPDSGRA